ncbi:MAG: hypothetical protein LAN63_07300 [Acidobacteriia bacterium]|nr:hypothetical protein [Terriglobia bacterium]
MPWKSARYLISWSQLSLLVLLLSAGLLANAIAQTAKPPASTTSSPKPEAKPKLTPTQEQGLRLLKAAEAEAGALEPAMRAAVLWQVAHGYYKVDKPRVLLTLIDAFRAATTVEDDHPELKCFLVPDECHSKTWLQVNILREMLTSPQKVEELLPQADPDVRPVLTGELISKYVRDKKLDRAQQLLLRLSDEKDFPYDAASELMLAVPSDQQRVAIFNQAMSNFQTFGEGKFGLIAPEDLGTLVIRFWRHLPPATVLEAVDQLLGQAKTESEKHDDNQISLTTKQGGVSFSPYQYRLFELIPVLQELDSSRAESLLHENVSVAGALQKYPDGLRSLNPLYRDTPATQEEQMADFPSMTMGGSASDAAADQVLDQWQRQVLDLQIRVRKEVRTDPKKALSTAMAIPLWGPSGPGSHSPRTNTLAELAVVAAKKDPDTATKALEEVRKVLDQMKPRDGGRLLRRIAETYLNMGDQERAEKALHEGMKIAEKLYASDTDASEPNLALKAEWLSAGLWRRLVTLATRISPQLAEQLVADISDPEIRALQKVSLANALLGAPDYPFRSIAWREGGHDNTMWAF